MSTALRLCSGTLKGAATQTFAKTLSFTSLKSAVPITNYQLPITKFL